MIDRKSRDTFAHIIENYTTGQITNEELTNSWCNLKSKDRALHEIFWHGIWRLYSDLDEYKAIDEHALTPTQKDLVERSILFLRFDLEYKWPHIFWLYNFPGYVFIILTLGLLHIIAQRVIKKSGDFEVWPFQSIDEYDKEVNTKPSRRL